MNQGLRNELAVIAGATSLSYLLRGRGWRALGYGALSVALPLIKMGSNYNFINKSVIITGGSRGLGFILARKLLKQGAMVTLLARDSEELHQARVELERVPYARVLTITCDVTKREDLESAVREVQVRFGRIDALINNAGAISAGPFETMDVEDFKAQMDLHFYSTLQATQLVTPIFKRSGGGRVINIISIGAKSPMAHMAPYTSSKYAQSGLSKAMSLELKKDNIVVTSVYPGLMRTGSPIQGVFKGDQEKEFAWFSAVDNMPGLSIDAEVAADQIIEAAKQGRSELIISAPAKLGAFAHSNFPELTSRLMNVINKFLPQGDSKVRKTGAQSQGWLKKQVWSQGLQTSSKANEARYNQKEKYDANFNLGTKPISN